jgi:hypothetical protein
VEYDIEKIRTHLQLGLRHLLNAQKDRDRAGILDVLEVAYARDCLAVALDECRSREPEAIAKVRGSNNFGLYGARAKGTNVGSSQQVTVPNSASQDIASRGLAAAHRVDEAKQLYNKAEAVWVYAQRSSDYELQNKAAEIRLFAERRAGELLAEMAMHPGSRGQGRPRRDGAKIVRSNGATAYPAKPDEIGVIKGQSSKWQQLTRWISALSSKSRMGAMLFLGLHGGSRQNHFASVKQFWGLISAEQQSRYEGK